MHSCMCSCSLGSVCAVMLKGKTDCCADRKAHHQGCCALMHEVTHAASVCDSADHEAVSNGEGSNIMPDIGNHPCLLKWQYLMVGRTCI